MRLTREQRESLYRKWLQDSQGLTYKQFRKGVFYGPGCIMINWCGMWLGIETDGYTHS